MFPNDTILGVFLLFQFCIGILGNSLVFILYVYTFFIQPHFKKPIDSIFMHLMVVNMLTILLKMIPAIVSFSGVTCFLDDADCKAVLYLHRVSQSLSICTTCILSTFQAITIAPRNSKWAWLKPKLCTWAVFSFLFSWFINMIIYVSVIENVLAKTNYTHVGHGFSQAYCEANWPGSIKPE